MSDNRKILLEVNIDAEQTIRKIGLLKDTISSLQDQNKSLKKQYEENKISWEEYNQGVVKNEALIRANKKSLAELQKTIDNQVKANTSAEGSYNQLYARHQLLTQSLREMSAEQRQNTEVGKAMEAEAKAIWEQLKQLQAVTGPTTLNVANYSESIKSAVDESFQFSSTIEGMRAQLKQLEEVIRTSDVGSKQFKDASDNAAKLRLQIDQALGKVNEFGERQPKNPAKKAFEDAFSTAGALTSSVQLLNVALGDNRSLAELQAKSLQAIAVAQNVANIVKEKGAIIDTLTLVKTKALTVAQRLYTIAVGQTTGAMRTLRAVIASTGFGAILVGLGLLITNFKEVSSFISDLRGKLRSFLTDLLGNEQAAEAFAFALELIVSPITLIISGINEVINLFGKLTSPKITTDVDALNSALELMNNQFEKQLKPLEDNIKLMKAKGASDKEVANAEIELLKKRADRWNAYAQRVQQHVEAIKKSGRSLTEEEAKALEEFEQKVADANLALKIAEAEQEKERKKAAQEAAKKRKEELQKLKELELSLLSNIERAKIEAMEDGLAKQEALIELEAAKQIEALNKQREELVKNKQLTTELAELFGQRQAHIEQDKERKIQEIQSRALDDRLKEQEEWYNSSLEGQIKALERKRDLDTIYAEKTVLNEKEKAKKLLEIQLQYYEDALRLLIESLSIAGEEQRVALEQQIDQVVGLINGIKQQLQTTQPVTNILGLSPEQLKQAENGLQQLQQGFATLNDIINAAYQTQLNQIAAKYQAEEEAIRNSGKSEKQKEKELEALRRKRAMDEWKVQKEQFEVNQATSIANAIIAGALAALQALAQLGPIGGAIASALIAATTAAQIAVIASQPPPPKPSFYEGGFTEMSGNPYAKSSKSNQYRDVHHNEYIVPWKVLQRPDSFYHIAALEAMRKSTNGFIPLSGYANGGFVQQPGIDTDSIRAIVADTVKETVRGVNIITRVTDINRVAADKADNMAKATL